jgi:hypothetical protein
MVLIIVFLIQYKQIIKFDYKILSCQQSTQMQLLPNIINNTNII